MVAWAKLFLFAAVTTASVLPLEEREVLQVRELLERQSASVVLADLREIDTRTKNVTTNANAYSGGLANALKIQNAATYLDNYIKNDATNHANAISGTVSSTDATSVINYINNTLEPDISAAVTAVINKRTQLRADGLGQTAKNLFQTLYDDTNSYSTILVNKTPSAQKSAASSAKSKVLADLQRGIDAFP